MKLSDLHTGQRAIITGHNATGSFRKRLLEMGFIVGHEVLVVKNAPLEDPVQYRILNSDISLRRSEASTIDVEIRHGQQDALDQRSYEGREEMTGTIAADSPFLHLRKNDKTIKVAFIGNPNCGKTSLFNAASGTHEHVGNYSGVTVEAKTAPYHQAGYDFELVDLPGTYSLSSYSPEERFINAYLSGPESPDVIINVVDSSNLERNLYMTTQIMESGLPICVALNMFDEFEGIGGKIDIPMLTKLLGVPLVPTVARQGKGLKALFGHVITLFENRSKARRIVDVHYPEEVEQMIYTLKQALDDDPKIAASSLGRVRNRYLAIKLLERDEEMLHQLKEVSSKAEYYDTKARFLVSKYDENNKYDLQSVLSDTRYGFVHGALRETVEADFTEFHSKNSRIDNILTHKIWGLPIFVLFMFITFQATFVLGAYPMDWIEQGVAWLGEMIGSTMSDGPFKDLLVDGVIAGVGGVIVFLPNIIILYLFISIMEDTGYMARAAFIMDRLMHMMGLHGKSFIPMIMGFGCNVPAIMATRTVESRNSRMITMLIIPFMSCSARLPVYLLLAGAFFPHHAGLVMFSLYFLGIAVAIVSALLFKKTLFKHEDAPFVMELPPYRWPTTISVFNHMWRKSKQYLQKMGTVILLASIAVWALGYFPHYSEEELLAKADHPTYVAQHSASDNEELVELSPEQKAKVLQQEYSYIGRIGHFIEPVFRPLGFDWKMSVALLTGAAAKEIVVSTMGVLYAGVDDDEVLLADKLKSATHPDGSTVYTPLVAYAFMVFVLLYFPCIATIVAIGKESGSSKWAWFSMIYTCVVGWIVAYLCTLIGAIFV